MSFKRYLSTLFIVFILLPVCVHALDITQNNFGYTSQHSNVYGGFREYDSEKARFQEMDTYTPYTKKPVFNTYAYVKGNPILFEDPSGHGEEHMISWFEGMASASGTTLNASEEILVKVKAARVNVLILDSDVSDFERHSYPGSTDHDSNVSVDSDLPVDMGAMYSANRQNLPNHEDASTAFLTLSMLNHDGQLLDPNHRGGQLDNFLAIWGMQGNREAKMRLTVGANYLIGGLQQQDARYMFWRELNARAVGRWSLNGRDHRFDLPSTDRKSELSIYFHGGLNIDDIVAFSTEESLHLQGSGDNTAFLQDLGGALQSAGYKF